MARLLARTIIWYWGPALLMLALIGLESTDLLSAAHTGGYFIPLLHRIIPSLSPGQLEFSHVIARKIGHAIGYGMLSWLLFRASWGTAAEQQFERTTSWKLPYAAFGFFGAAVVAISDELHQMTIPSRGGSVHDMFLDTSAALLAQIIIWLVFRRAAPAKVSTLAKPRPT